jgi:hypothetical protein
VRKLDQILADVIEHRRAADGVEQQLADAV